MQNAIAIAGGIATGKSTVSNLLRLHGFSVLDLDAVSRELYVTKTQEVERIFGTAERAAVGRLAFGDGALLKALEDLLLPGIFARALEFSDAQERLGLPYFLEIPLFFEKQNYPISRVLLVYAPRDLQLARLMARNGLSSDEARARLDSQLDIETKRQKATWVIENTQDIKHLTNAVDGFVKALRG